MTAPSNASTSGLAVVAWRYRTAPHRDWHETECSEVARVEEMDGSEVEPLHVTAASAQARIADEQAKAYAERQCTIEENRLRLAAEARADRLAKALEAARETLNAIDCPLTTDRTVAGAAKHAVKRIDAALQQETQK